MYILPCQFSRSMWREMVLNSIQILQYCILKHCHLQLVLLQFETLSFVACVTVVSDIVNTLLLYKAVQSRLHVLYLYYRCPIMYYTCIIGVPSCIIHVLQVSHRLIFYLYYKCLSFLYFTWFTGISATVMYDVIMIAMCNICVQVIGYRIRN